MNNISLVHIAECAGGVERYLQMLLPRLRRKGLQQFFICSFNYDKNRYIDIVDGVEQVDLRQSFNPIQIIKKVRAIRCYIRNIRPDIVYCHSSFAGGLGRLACMGLPCKVVYNPHGWAFNMNGASKNLKCIGYALMEKFLAKMTDKIVCISEAEKDSALRKKISKEDKLELIPNGIDIHAVQDAPAKSRDELGIASDAFVVGMIGRISPQKAPDIFIRAAKLISDNIANSVFIIVGDGDDRNKIEHLAKENNVRLIVTGWTDEPYSYLKIFDVAMLLSRWEGFGLAIVEYMAAEKPVVATRVDAIPTLIKDGINGLLANVDDPEDVKEKVIWLYNHRSEAQKIREAALKNTKDNYDICRVVDQHYNMFVKLCE